MKKTFKLKIEGQNEDRLLESIKHEIRKYIKRERKKNLPENVDYWDFNCKFAKEDETPQTIHISEVINYVDRASKDDCQQFYLEILAIPGYRIKNGEHSTSESNRI